jgi:hypothetical protein
MKIYTGTSWNKVNIQKCIEYNIGWCSSPQDPIQPYDIDPKINFIYDNGAFRASQDYIKGKTKSPRLNESLFYSQISRMIRQPDFVCVPDIVAGGMNSYEFSLKHIDKIPYNKYFVVQDGMYFDAVYYAISKCEGVFVGGSVDLNNSLKGWKWDTAYHWIQRSHEIGLPCHIGRVGRLEGYFKAYDLGADSVDGSTIIRHNKLDRVKEFRELLEGRKMIMDYREKNLARSVIPSDELQELRQAGR